MQLQFQRIAAFVEAELEPTIGARRWRSTVQLEERQLARNFGGESRDSPATKNAKNS